MISFCHPNESLSHPWVNHGLNRCFVSTLSSSILCILFLVPGLAQIYIYRKHGQPITSSLRSKSWFLYLHIILSLIIPFLSLSQTMVFALMNDLEHVYGYMAYSIIVMFIIWPLSAFVLHTECSYVLLNLRGRGHGLLLLCFWALSFLLAFLPLVSISSSDWWWNLSSVTNVVEFTLWILYASFVSFIFILGIWAPGLPSYFAVYEFFQSSGHNASATENVWVRRIRRLKIVSPFIWPKHKTIQLRVFSCFVLLIVGRIINLYSPILYKDIVNSLSVVDNSTRLVSFAQNLVLRPSPYAIFNAVSGHSGLIYRWDYVLLFALLRLLQGLGGLGAGLISALRSQLWIAVDQFSTRGLSVMLFKHIQRLSLRWHLSRKTGEVLRVMDRGTASISNILSYLVFNMLPTVLDIIIGVVYFVAAFNIWYGLLVFVTMLTYIVSTVLITEWRAKFRREMNNLDNQKNTKAVDAVLNFETVKYYNAEQFETDRYNQAFLDYQKADWWNAFTLNVLNTTQNVVISVGFTFGILLCARDVVNETLTVGHFVLFCTYIIQLYSPLSIFGTYYRLLQSSFIDMENMFDLLEEKIDISDEPNAPELIIKESAVEFNNVCFSYNPERPILKNVSFKIPSGHTVALVGESGSGKSTIVRLLFRFYDTSDGEILIDGQNIKSVTQASLRQSLGVVPQDTVLFNDTIYYNIRYGRQSASQSEIEDVAIAADIHRCILDFPKRYETVVGERGLKLSGGEKQRVAIARNLLKNPSIMILDEATSALDTTTERNIQASLNRIAQNRTTLVVAHRLSTIIHANEILVLHEGEIVERGTHSELLLNPKSRYAELWRQQSEVVQQSSTFSAATSLSSPVINKKADNLSNADSMTNHPVRV
ncbi:ATP-binding cassette sub-family B member 6 [Schistosoma japonicum]|uniref:ATP-binding cassette sub-family B member 6 n=1 Tax=Schistosoma japonicum TaxID=6182 RepID=A0A4Z2DHK7_SCHJA|nr:ATP-binding cassette sub-family B member 6 [Schistosoma japonicum]